MLDKDFYDFLEYALTSLFRNSTDDQVKHFWCDGVMLPAGEEEYTKKQVNDNRQVQLKAFAGKTGQDEYTLVLLFGNKALSRFARGLDIKECIPGISDFEKLAVDIDNKIITLQLD